jgi:tetratricopeptide (TPR) repeat protein
MLRAPWGRARAAQELLDGGEPHEAQRVLEALVADWPSYATAYKFLGMTLLDLGKPLRAREVLQRARELDPANGSTLYLLVTAHQRLGEKEEARHAAALLRRLKPFDEPVLALCDAVFAEPLMTPRMEDASTEDVGRQIALGARAVEETLGPIDMGPGEALLPAIEAASGDAPREGSADVPGRAVAKSGEERDPVWGGAAAGSARISLPKSLLRAQAAGELPMEFEEERQPPARTLEEDLAARAAPPIETMTIADIYVEQGLYQQAMRIYKKHQEFRPSDPTVAQRIRELEEKITQEDVD